MRRASLRPLPFVLAATDTGTMIVNRNDHCTNAAGLTYGVGHQFLNTASFDADEVDALLRLLHLRRQYFGDGVTALDCGANIGAHSIAWGIEMTHWGKVVAFEAQERIFYALAGNIAINNCFNVKAVHAALGCPAGGGAVLPIPVPDYNRPASFGSLELRGSERNEFIGQAVDYGRTEPVPLMAVDALDLPRVDLMKIDVEGMETEVLAGAAQTVARHLPVLQIEILKTDHDAVRTVLEPLGYRFYYSGINMLAVHRDDPCGGHIQTSAA